MVATKKRVLLLGLQPLAELSLTPLLRRADLAVSKLEHPARALELLHTEMYRLVVAGHPLAEISVPRLARELRAKDSASRDAGLLVITEGEPPDEVKKLVGQGINSVLSAGAPPADLQRTGARLLEVAPRAGIRALVKVKVHIGNGESAFLSQTENISASGALVRSERRPDLGTRLPLEMMLPGDPLPLRCEGEVVRHTNIGREQHPGFALRYVTLSATDRLRIERAVERMLNRTAP
jgi:hypothetical protein